MYNSSFRVESRWTSTTVRQGPFSLRNCVGHRGARNWGASTLPNFSRVLIGKEHVVGALWSATKNENYSNLLEFFVAKTNNYFLHVFLKKGNFFELARVLRKRSILFAQGRRYCEKVPAVRPSCSIFMELYKHWKENHA